MLRAGMYDDDWSAMDTKRFEDWGIIGGAVTAFLGGCAAMLHRRKATILTDAQLSQIHGEVAADLRDEFRDSIDSLRREILETQRDLGREMEKGVMLMKAGVAHIEELVIDVPSIKDQLAEQEVKIRSIKKGIAEIREELERLKDR